jgi:hypothetical protein
MIEPAATARARGARSIASSLLAAVLAVCGIFTASALAASPRLPIIVCGVNKHRSGTPGCVRANLLI